MGEYGREQRNQINRNIESNGLINEQISKFIDNSSNSLNQVERINVIIQKKEEKSCKKHIGTSNNIIQCSLFDLLLLMRLGTMPSGQFPQHKHLRNRHISLNRTQRRRERKKQHNLRKRRRKQRENIIKKIYEELKKTDNVPCILRTGKETNLEDYPRSFSEPLNPEDSQGNRRYKIVIDPKNPIGFRRTSQELIDATLVHEKTHIICDMAYSMNKDQSKLSVFHRKEGILDEDHQQEQMHFSLLPRIVTLDRIVQNDDRLTEIQKNDIATRLGYAYLYPYKEYDPVINELLVYTKLYKIPANSNTVIALVQLGNENYRRRNEGKHFEGEWPS